MDNAARAGGSSSRNAERIARISAGRAGRCEVHLLDGSTFSVPRSLVVDLGLREGATLGREAAAALRTAARGIDAEEKAIELLARRDHSVSRLKAKLVERGFDAGAVDAACASLLRRGYLDDGRFARLWLESRIRRRNEGRAKLLAGLVGRGVDRMVAAQALSEIVSDSYEEEAFSRAVAEIERVARGEPKRIARRLSTRGFRAEFIGRYLDGVRKGRECD